MDYLPTLGENWPHSRGNVGKYSLHGVFGTCRGLQLKHHYPSTVSRCVISVWLSLRFLSNGCPLLEVKESWRQSAPQKKSAKKGSGNGFFQKLLKRFMHHAISGIQLTSLRNPSKQCFIGTSVQHSHSLGTNKHPRGKQLPSKVKAFVWGRGPFCFWLYKKRRSHV